MKFLSEFCSTRIIYSRWWLECSFPYPSISVERGEEEVTIGAISGPSEALPSSKLSKFQKLLSEGGELRVAMALSATLRGVLPIPGSPEILTAGKIYMDTVRSTEDMDVITWNSCDETRGG